jgi:hypothetical protein
LQRLNHSAFEAVQFDAAVKWTGSSTVGHAWIERAVLTNADVITLKKAGLGDDLIIEKISASATAFKLDASDLVELHQAGVPDAVIKTMMHAPRASTER